MDDDIRKPDKVIVDKLIDNNDIYEEEEDEELKKALIESMKTTSTNIDINLNHKLNNNLNNDISNREDYHKIIDTESVRLEKYKQEQSKKEEIEERELMMRPVMMYLNRLKLKDLISVIHIYIETGSQLDNQYYHIFKKELKPSIFSMIESIFKDDICSDDYYYDDDD